MIEEAKQVAQRLREYALPNASWQLPKDAAHTIDALVQEVERLKQEQAEPVLYQYRWLNPANNQHDVDLMGWRLVETRHPHTDPIQGRIKELESYRYDGKVVYEIRALYTAPQGQTALLKQALKSLEDEDFDRDTRKAHKLMRAIKRHLGEA